MSGVPRTKVPRTIGIYSVSPVRGTRCNVKAFTNYAHLCAIACARSSLNSRSTKTTRPTLFLPTAFVCAVRTIQSAVYKTHQNIGRRPPSFGGILRNFASNEIRNDFKHINTNLFAASKCDDCDQVSGHTDKHVAQACDRCERQQSRRISVEKFVVCVNSVPEKGKARNRVRQFNKLLDMHRQQRAAVNGILYNMLMLGLYVRNFCKYVG